MPISNDLLSLEQVGEYFGLSESTIRRKVRASRKGLGNFPLPLFSANSRVLFRRSEIENWRGEDAEVTTFNPSSIPQSLQPQNAAQVRRVIETLGTKIDNPTYR